MKVVLEAGNKEVKLSFRLTQAEAARLSERSRPGESPSKAGARILGEALTQTDIEYALKALPALAAAAKALVEDVPEKLAAQILERVSIKSADLISQKISDISAAQAGRDDANRLVTGKILEGIDRIKAVQDATAASVVAIKKLLS